MDRQQMDGQIEKSMYRQIDRKTDRKINRYKDERYIDKQKDTY